MIGKTTRVLREKLQDCHGDTMVEVLAGVVLAAVEKCSLRRWAPQCSPRW